MADPPDGDPGSNTLLNTQTKNPKRGFKGFIDDDESTSGGNPSKVLKAYKSTSGAMKLTWSEDNLLFNFTDQGPYTVYMENVTTTDKPISDIKVGKLLVLKRIKDIIEIKRIGRNRVKLGFAKKESANQLLKDSTLATENLKAYIPTILIQRIGIIKYVDEDLTNEEIKDNIYIKNIKVKEASRFMKTIRDPKDNTKDKKVPTGTVKVTFAGQTLPEVIDLYGAKRKVTPYYFSVTQCFGCYRFGHTQKNCRGKKKCRTCGENMEDNSHEKCSNKVKCVNCNENHSSTDKQCEERMRQETIKRVMVDENISFFEANEKFPKISNRFEMLEHLGDFPELPVSKNVHRVLENHREDTYKMYNNYKQKKLVNSNNRLDNRKFSQMFEDEERIPSSPITNNPYKASDFEKFRKELKDIKLVFDNFCKNDINKSNPANNDLVLMEIGDKINRLVQVCLKMDTNNHEICYSEQPSNSELPPSGGTVLAV